MMMPNDESTLKKHSIVIAGHQTSFTLENIYWHELKKIAGEKEVSLGKLVAEIDSDRNGNLSSAIRVYVLKKYLKS